MTLKTTNWTISTLLILINIYFLPLSFVLIKSTGGTFGYGLLVLPNTLSINLLLISAGLTFKTKLNNSIGLLLINGIGLLWSLFWFWLLVTTPKMDQKMNNDELVLLLSFLLYWAILICLVIKSKNKKQVLIINLTIHVIYSGYFLYGLFYRSHGNGASLRWWFYILLTLWVHWIINLGELIYLLIKTKKRTK